MSVIIVSRIQKGPDDVHSPRLVAVIADSLHLDRLLPGDGNFLRRWKNRGDGLDVFRDALDQVIDLQVDNQIPEYRQVFDSLRIRIRCGA